MEKIELTKLNEEVEKFLEMAREVEPGESLNLPLTLISASDNGEKCFNLDDVEFWQGSEEELQNAIELCIEEEFMPRWLNSDINGFDVESVEYIDGEPEGSVNILVY